MRTKSQAGERGFTLLELTVVITIIGVLAAVAIPAFMKYIRKAHTGEVRINLQSIAALERAYHVDHREWLACPKTPAKVPTEPVKWPGGDCWDKLGFKPDATVQFQYEVVIEKDRFVARAHGDLDADGDYSTFELFSTHLSMSRTKELE